MGSPVRPVLANLCMEVIEESAIAASTTPPKVWKRYVDDGFVIIKEHSVSKFHDTLNAVDHKISFTIETENNDQIFFLDTMTTRKMRQLPSVSIENPRTLIDTWTLTLITS